MRNTYPLANKTVLIVEDDVSVRLVIEDFVMTLGCSNLLSLTSEQQALGSLSRLRPDLAIIDINLNGENTPSFFLADELVGRGIPFAFCTGMFRYEIEPRHSKRPMLKKPFSLEDLSHTVALTMGTHLS